MRIRFKPWARPELEASYFYEDIPENYIGKWREKFKNPNQPLHIYQSLDFHMTRIWLNSYCL